MLDAVASDLFDNPDLFCLPVAPIALPRELVDRRLAALRDYAILDTPAEEEYDAIARLAAEICATPMSAVSFVADIRQWLKAAHNMTEREQPIATSFCAHALTDPDVFVVPDATMDARFRSNPMVTGPFGLRFYAGAPIRARDGTPLGALCVVDTQPRPDGLNASQRQTLLVLARQVEAQLELRRTVAEQQRQLSRQRKMASQLRHMAEHDPLTGLPNRVTFRRELEAALAIASEDEPAVLMLVDVDHFKLINDSIGHDAGDVLLKTFAQRMRASVRSDDVVARVGGDEFAILLRSCGTSGIERLAETLSDRLTTPFDYMGRTIECRASIGYAIAPQHADDVDRLEKHADLALADAKDSGRNCARGFRETMAEAFENDVARLDVARSALRRGGVVPFYQPKFCLATNRIVGVEALLRLENECGELLLRGAIAPAFRDPLLAVQMTHVMIDRVLADVAAWNAARVMFGHVGINTSAADFARDDFAETLIEKLDTAGVSPGCIEVEVTETVLLGRGRHHVERALEKLRAYGVAVALDDFGTGHASLTNLKTLPITGLKIDRSFVSGLGARADNAIVSALVLLGRQIGLSIVAEGVETDEQRSQLLSLGATIGQGFLFSPAIRADAFVEFARSGTIAAAA